MKAQFLRLHRWIALVFAVPLAIIIVTGLMLSIEPMLNDRAVSGRSLPLAQIEAALAKFDPDKKATTLNVRAYDGVLSLAEGRGSGPRRIDVTSNTLVPADRTLWSDTLTTARRLHETLLLDLGWLVIASTYAMLAMIVLGLLMGWPYLRNTLGGWHRATAWGLLPLLILSPLSGLGLAHGITFAPPPARVEGPPVPLHDAVKLVAAKHDLASVIWIRPQGGAMRARLIDGREAKVFAVTRNGLVEGPRGWPRLIHEGVWGGLSSGLINLVTSLAMVPLMATGVTIWGRRWLRRGLR